MYERKVHLSLCMNPGVYALQNRTEHRVDRVLSFFSSRPNLDSPTPLPAGECVTPPRFGGGEHTRLPEREWGSPNSDEQTNTVVL